MPISFILFMEGEYDVWKYLWKRKEPAKRLIGCRSVENFKKLNMIEEGTYGIVYRGQDNQTGDIVALKKLKLAKEKEGFPITSLREVATLSLFKHENIVNVREVVVGREIQDVFIVMDFIAHDFKTLLEENLIDDALTVSEIKTIMLQLFRGIGYLHENWIVHRDIKATNLLFSHGGQVKIADFGLARKFGEPLPIMTPLVVTLWYRAPELLLGEKRYTEAIDIWSLGCMLAELVLKKPLFSGTGEIDQLYQVIPRFQRSLWYVFLQFYRYLKSLAFRMRKYGLDSVNCRIWLLLN
jgi:cell division cycle 2-like